METFPVTDFEEAATAAISNVRNSIDKWSNTLKARKNSGSVYKKVQIAYPAFQWAQSLSNIYLNIKYSHKMDSPGYLEIKNETVNITDNKVYLSGDIVKVFYRFL